MRFCRLYDYRRLGLFSDGVNLAYGRGGGL